MPKPTTPADFQTVAAKIAARARKDSTFYRTLLKAPRETLLKAGVGVDVARELINQDAFLRNNFSSSAAGDCTVTCICTDSCCVTCWAGTSARIAGDILSNPGRVEFGGRDGKLKVDRNRQELLNNLVDLGHIRIPR
jgi:hypothetical protein